MKEGKKQKKKLRIIITILFSSLQKTPRLRKVENAILKIK